MTYTKKSFLAIGSGIATLALVAVPAFAATSVTITGSGAFSNTTVKVTKVSINSTNQSNHSKNINFVGQGANTGNNTQSFNTGGTNNTTTGNVTQDVTITNNGNSNTASGSASLCGCDTGNTTVDASGSGAFSNTTVKVKNVSISSTSQSNKSTNVNGVWQGANTGGNDSSFNTNGGNSITTGDVTQTTTITNSGGTNTL